VLKTVIQLNLYQLRNSFNIVIGMDASINMLQGLCSLHLPHRTEVLIDCGCCLAKYLGKLTFCTQKNFLHAHS